MINRNKYDKVIEKIKEIYSHHEGLDFDKSMNQIMNIKNFFDIKLMIVGHYNAGKSSLINRLIGRDDFLKVDQKPQTAIATEIIFDENESAYSYDSEGNKEVLDRNKDYTPQNCNHIEYRINAPSLKEINDFTIVDTPGFDAGIEAHAKALANYIGIGSAYIVVIDQEKGGIDEITLNFIKEISNYSSQIAVLINKCDKITDEVAENIKQSAKDTLMTYGMSYEVYTVSKRDNNIQKKLIEIINSFNAQVAFDRTINKLLNSELESLLKVLSIIEKKLYMDTYDIDSEIAGYTRILNRLSESFEKQRNDVKNDINNAVERINNNIKEALITRADSVAEAMLSGNQVAAEAIIIETIRPIMLSTIKELSLRQIDDITRNLDFTGVVNESDEIDLTEVTKNLANNIRNLIEQGEYGNSDIKGGIDNNKKNQYRIIAGIAAALTDIVAPWLEVIIILLPDIISLLNGLFGESNLDKTKRAFIGNVIPQIMNKIYPEIRSNVETTSIQLIDEYENMLKERIESINKSISTAQNKRLQKIEDFENYKIQIKSDVETIVSLLSR